MNIETKDFGSYTEVSVCGNLSYGNWRLIVDEVMDVYKAGSTHVFLNWSDVMYFDSSGLQSLVALYNYIKGTKGKSLALITSNDEHVKILKLISFEKLFPIYSSVEEAKEEQMAV